LQEGFEIPVISKVTGLSQAKTLKISLKYLEFSNKTSTVSFFTSVNKKL